MSLSLTEVFRLGKVARPFLRWVLRKERTNRLVAAALLLGRMKPSPYTITGLLNLRPDLDRSGTLDHTLLSQSDRKGKQPGGTLG